MLHHKLLAKLNHYGIRRKSHSSFLSEGTQKVVVDGVTSDTVGVVTGVPQGAVLESIPSVINSNDLPSYMNSAVRVFADDALQYRPIHSKSDQDILQSDLDALEV